MTVIRIQNEHLWKTLFNSLIIEGTSNNLKFAQRILKRHAYTGYQESWNEFTNNWSIATGNNQLYSIKQKLFTFLWTIIICITTSFLQFLLSYKIAQSQWKTHNLEGCTRKDIHVPFLLISSFSAFLNSHLLMIIISKIILDYKKGRFY